MMSSRMALSLQKLPQHVVKNPAVAVVLHLLRGVEPHAGLEVDRGAVVAAGLDRYVAAGLEAGIHSGGEAGDGEDFVTGETEALDGLAVDEFERRDAHADQVAAVDALEALGDHGAHPLEEGTLGRPVARGAGAVLLAGEDDGGHVLGAVL